MTSVLLAADSGTGSHQDSTLGYRYEVVMGDQYCMDGLK